MSRERPDPWREIAGQAQTQWEAFLADPYAEEPVHQARVKLRQLRSMLSAVKKAVPPEEYVAWQEEWRDMGRLLSELRQFDVLEEARRLIEKQSGPHASSGQPLPWRRLRQQKTAAVREKALVKQCEQPWRRFDAWLARYRQAVSRRQERKAARQRFDRWVKQIEAISRQDRSYRDDRLVHERRIAGKKLRYALVAFFPDEAPELVQALKRWQACLGALHDSLLHRDLAVRWAAEKQLLPEQKGLLLGWEAARAVAARKQAAMLEALVVQHYWQWRNKRG